MLTKVDSQQLNLDYDKKVQISRLPGSMLLAKDILLTRLCLACIAFMQEMMIFWGKIMNEESERNLQLARFKPVGNLLRKFYVCLQNNPTNAQFHREVLPIYFGLVLRFCKLDPTFHLEWAQCNNYTWAIGAMKWGTFTQHVGTSEAAIS